MTESSIVRLPKQTMIRALHRDAVFAELFTTYLLSRSIRMEEDLVDQLFNSSEKRLARILLLPANFGKDGRNRSSPRSVRKRWPRWSAPRARASASS